MHNYIAKNSYNTASIFVILLGPAIVYPNLFVKPGLIYIYIYFVQNAHTPLAVFEINSILFSYIL